MKVMIVAPVYRPLGKYYELPLGIAYISSSLKKAGHDVTLINENEERLIIKDYDMWYQKVTRDSEVLLTGGLSVHYSKVKEIINKTKSFNPDIITIAGGGLVSSEPELMLEDLGVDYAVVGEGENIVLDILGGSVKQGVVKADSIDSIDNLSYPDYDGLKVNNYLERQVCGDDHYTYPVDNPRVLPIISSRSCPFNCTFCFHPLGNKYRQRDTEAFGLEVENLKTKYNINLLAVLDELISADCERLAKICDVLKRFDLKWMTQMRVSKVSREMLMMMKDAGCFQISFGIEHVDSEVLKSMNKKITMEEIDNALSLASEVGIGIQGNLLLGDKAETPGSLKNALDWWEKNIRYGVNLTNVLPLPGSDLYKHYVDTGDIPDKLAYIKNGCQFIDKHFGVVGRSMLSLSLEKNKLPSEVIEVTHAGKDFFRGQLFNAKIKCYHCNSINEYKNLYMDSTGSSFLQGKGYRIGCRTCNQRTDFKLEVKCRALEDARL